jgi:hypothetical protein
MTAIAHTVAIASGSQISFVRDLIESREVDQDIAVSIEEAISAERYPKRQASLDIEAFLKLPKRAKASRSGMQLLLASVPKSKYAVPVSELEFTNADNDFRGDLVFIEVKEYMQTLYIRQLHGAPGSFVRSKLSNASTKAIVNLISADTYKYVKLFGDNYACCGSCGAELTDPKSRELMLGPECRKKFGF